MFPDAPAAAEPNRALTFQEATRRFPETLLRTALVESDWNISQVARDLALARSHVYNLIRAFGIEPPK